MIFVHQIRTRDRHLSEQCLHNKQSSTWLSQKSFHAPSMWALASLWINGGAAWLSSMFFFLLMKHYYTRNQSICHLYVHSRSHIKLDSKTKITKLNDPDASLLVAACVILAALRFQLSPFGNAKRKQEEVSTMTCSQSIDPRFWGWITSASCFLFAILWRTSRALRTR